MYIYIYIHIYIYIYIYSLTHNDTRESQSTRVRHDEDLVSEDCSGLQRATRPTRIHHQRGTLHPTTGTTASPRTRQQLWS